MEKDREDSIIESNSNYMHLLFDAKRDLSVSITHQLRENAGMPLKKNKDLVLYLHGV